jgi:serine/threonine protein kinase
MARTFWAGEHYAFQNMLATCSAKDLELVRKPIGTGKVGTVRLAHLKVGPSPQKTFVVKTLSSMVPYDAVCSETELQISADHPNVLKCFGCREEYGISMIFLEHADGGDLTAFLAKTPLDEKKASSLAYQIGKGLGHIHSLGIIHCDIKLENILMVGGVPKIGDFGIAIKAPTSISRGTCESFCPEIVECKPYTNSADVWAFGVLIFEMVAGYSPFSRFIEEDPATFFDRVMYRIKTIDYAMDSKFSLHLATLIRSVFVYDPTKRPSIDELVKFRWFLHH